MNCLIPVMSFLQERLDGGHAFSMLKLYVAAMSALSRIDGRPVGRNDLVVKPLHGMRWLNPPRPSTIPTWDLTLLF